MPSCSFSILLNGKPAPYLSNPTMLAAVASYLSLPTPSGAGAVNTSPHRLQRSRSQAYTVAESGAIPVMRTSFAGSFCG